MELLIFFGAGLVLMQLFKRPTQNTKPQGPNLKPQSERDKEAAKDPLQNVGRELAHAGGCAALTYWGGGAGAAACPIVRAVVQGAEDLMKGMGMPPQTAALCSFFPDRWISCASGQQVQNWLVGLGLDAQKAEALGTDVANLTDPSGVGTLIFAGRIIAEAINSVAPGFKQWVDHQAWEIDPLNPHGGLGNVIGRLFGTAVESDRADLEENERRKHDPLFHGSDAQRQRYSELLALITQVTRQGSIAAGLAKQKGIKIDDPVERFVLALALLKAIQEQDLDPVARSYLVQYILSKDDAFWRADDPSAQAIVGGGGIASGLVHKKILTTTLEYYTRPPFTQETLATKVKDLIANTNIPVGVKIYVFGVMYLASTRPAGPGEAVLKHCPDDKPLLSTGGQCWPTEALRDAHNRVLIAWALAKQKTHGPVLDLYLLQLFADPLSRQYAIQLLADARATAPELVSAGFVWPIAVPDGVAASEASVAFGKQHHTAAPPSKKTTTSFAKSAARDA